MWKCTQMTGQLVSILQKSALCIQNKSLHSACQIRASKLQCTDVSGLQGRRSCLRKNSAAESRLPAVQLASEVGSQFPTKQPMHCDSGQGLYHLPMHCALKVRDVNAILAGKFVQVCTARHARWAELSFGQSSADKIMRFCS